MTLIPSSSEALVVQTKSLYCIGQSDFVIRRIGRRSFVDQPCMTKTTACAHGATRYVRISRTGVCQHYCRACRLYFSSKKFRPSALRNHLSLCRMHMYAQAKRRITTRKPTMTTQLLRVLRALQQRERSRGGPSVYMSTDNVRRLLCRHGFTSALSGCRVTEATASLMRRDDKKPFNERTNCMLVTKTECHRRGRGFTK